MADIEAIVAKLTRARQRLLETVADLDEEAMDRSPAEGWSIREILHHVAIGERANVELVRQALAGQPVQMDDFDMHRWNVEQVARRAGRSAAEAIAELHAVREETLALLRTLRPQDLSRTLVHPGWGEMTIEQLFRALGTHDLMHRRDILRLLEGSAQA